MVKTLEKISLTQGKRGGGDSHRRFIDNQNLVCNNGRRTFTSNQQPMTSFTRYLPWKSFNEFFVTIVYFVQGAGALTAIASMNILKDELNLNFYQMGLIGVASTLPWTVKPIYGILTDLVPIGNYRRKPYLQIGPLIGFLGYLLMGLYGHTFATFFLPLVFANLGLALTDVATDGFIVEESTQENTARLQGITQISIRAASFITSFFSGLLIQVGLVSSHGMYLILAIIPLATFVGSFFIHEKPANAFKLFEPDPADSISLESSLEQHQSKAIVLKIFSPGYIVSLVLIFVLVMGNTVAGESIDAFLAAYVPWFPGLYLGTLIWSLFVAWMISYFYKLTKLKLASPMIFVAILFILLWRINPGAGSAMFFYVRDNLHVNIKTLGFIDTIAQIGSIVGVLLAVKFFDKIRLKKLLLVTVLIAAAFGLTSFAITRPEWATTIGVNPIFSFLGTLVAVPVYFFDSLFQWLFAGAAWVNPVSAAVALTGIEKFLYLQSILGELIFMIAYIPLLKFAVLITPKRAEATNYAIIASIMNIGLAISGLLSGILYNSLMARYHPTLEVTSIQVDVIEILIWINIITSMMCLLVLPFLKTREFVKE